MLILPKNLLSDLVIKDNFKSTKNTQETLKTGTYSLTIAN